MLERSLSMVSVLALAGLTPLFAAAPVSTSLLPSGGQRGSTVEVTVSGRFDPWPVDLWVSHPGIEAKASATKGVCTLKLSRELPVGVHFLRLFNRDGADVLRPFVVGTLPEVVEKEPNDSPSTAHAIEATCVVNGRLAKAGEVDCFAVKLKKGQTVVASVLANTTLRSPMDAVLQVTDEVGTVLGQNHDYLGLDPQIEFTAPKDGTYLLRLFAFPSQPDSSIRFAGGDGYVYRMTIGTGPVFDVALPLAVEGKATQRVRLEGWNLAEANRTRELAPDTANRSWVATDDSANRVAVRREPHPCFDFTTKPSEATLTAPFTLTGRLSKSETPQSFSIRGEKGKPLAVQVESGTLDRAMVPLLRILDEKGTQLARVEPAELNGDCSTTFNPPADGTFRLEVRDFYGKGGPRHVYLLRVVRPEPDFELTVAADRFALLPGKPLDLVVTVVKKNGFKDEVDLNVETLPEGVMVKATPTAAKKDGAVTLQFASEKPTRSFPFRIVGSVKGEPKRMRYAQLTGSGPDSGSEWLWMTGKE